jgi:hypothetical protein
MADDTQSVLNMNTSILANKEHDSGGVEDHTESDSDNSHGGGGSDAESEYEEYDLTENPLYQVLSAFLEDDEGNNLCDHIQQLTDAVKENSKRLDKLLSGDSSSKKVVSKKHR